MENRLSKIGCKYGSTITLQAIMPNGETNVKFIEWTFEDKDVATNCDTKKEFQIERAEFKDSGIYKCSYNQNVTMEYHVTVYENLFGDEFLGIRIALSGEASAEKPGMLFPNADGESQKRNIDSKTKRESETDIHENEQQKDTDDSRTCNSYQFSRKEVYPMTANTKGYAVIITIMEFENLPVLKGMKTYDTESCLKTFTMLKFKIKECKVAKREAILKYLDTIAKEDHTDYSCIVLFVGSHGGNGFVACSDFNIKTGEGVISFKTLVDIFLNVKSLQNKPKLLFFDCCREHVKGSPVSLRDVEPITTYNQVDEMQGHYRHVFIGFASISGEPSWNGLQGGIYTQALTKCLQEFAEKLSLLEIMGKVNETTLLKQTPIIHSTLERRVCFFTTK